MTLQRTLPVWCAVAVVAVCAAPSQAAAIVSKPPDIDSFVLVSDFDSSSNPQIADAFSPAVDALVTDVEWFGTYAGGSDPADPHQVRVRFFADGGSGHPVVAPFAETVFNLGGTPTGMTTTWGVDVYSWSGALSAPVTVLAGTTYWISVVDDTPGSENVLYWQATSPGTNVWLRNSDANNWGIPNPQSFRSQMAYNLSGDPLGGDPWSQPVDTGPNQFVQIGGGSGTPGGTDTTFANVTGGGTYTAEYQTTALADLTPEELAEINFLLPTDPLQSWSIDFTGAFDGLVEITFGYDDSVLLPGFPEYFLQIWHQLPDGEWEALPVVSRDLAANTITVETGSFSDFALGGIPEPGTLGLLALGALGVLRRRSMTLATAKC